MISDATVPLGELWPQKPVRVELDRLPTPQRCAPDVCSLSAPPGCFYFEHPSYGSPQIVAVPPKDDPQKPADDVDGKEWGLWKARA